MTQSLRWSRLLLRWAKIYTMSAKAPAGAALALFALGGQPPVLFPFCLCFPAGRAGFLWILP